MHISYKYCIIQKHHQLMFHHFLLHTKKKKRFFNTATQTDLWLNYPLPVKLAQLMEATRTTKRRRETKRERSWTRTISSRAVFTLSTVWVPYRAVHLLNLQGALYVNWQQAHRK